MFFRKIASVMTALVVVLGIAVLGGAAAPAGAVTSTTWSIVTSPNTSATLRNNLTGVACTSATACTGVGFSVDGASIFHTLIEQWNGNTWSIVSSPNTSTTRDNLLRSISCTSATACTAVGNYSNASGPQTLAEQWNGTIWSIVTSPNTSTTLPNYLASVSCTSATACTSVGDYSSGSAFQTLVERWDGSTC